MYHSFDPWEDTLDKYANPAAAEKDFLYHRNDGPEDKYKKNELYSPDNKKDLYHKKEEEEKKKADEIKDNIDKLIDQEVKYKKKEEAEEKKPAEDRFDSSTIAEQIDEIKEREEDKNEKKKNELLKSVEELILEMSMKKREVINLDKK
ncbi:hypothetical protein JXA85_07075 [Candidatus Woesearchaeota archaeon]|nr:hypothetical protein [Candidatus Woesearchaeota archaeon]